MPVESMRHCKTVSSARSGRAAGRALQLLTVSAPNLRQSLDEGESTGSGARV